MRDPADWWKDEPEPGITALSDMVRLDTLMRITIDPLFACYILKPRDDAGE